MIDPFEQAKQLFLDGVAHFEGGRLAQAESCFETSLALVPGRVSTLANLAATRVKLGRHADALAAFERLLALAPDDAPAWFRHAQTLQQLDRPADALASYDRVLALDPHMAQAWTNRGGILKELGRADDAALAFRQAIANGGDAALNGYYLAALTGEHVPGTPPRPYVERLFDDYAESFDEHLVGALGYRAHRVLVEHLQGIGPTRFRHALDLGCGTGLCGPLVKAVADRVDGVDLSAPMLEKARALGVYDRLSQADLAEYLERTERRHDLVLAADVFIYVGALETVFGGVRRVLEPGGIFCFSLEQAADDVDFELRASLRYAHSERYLRAIAAQAGFELVWLVPQAIREDQCDPIAGLYAYLRKP